MSSFEPLINSFKTKSVSPHQSYTMASYPPTYEANMPSQSYPPQQSNYGGNQQQQQQQQQSGYAGYPPQQQQSGYAGYPPQQQQSGYAVYPPQQENLVNAGYPPKQQHQNNRLTAPNDKKPTFEQNGYNGPSPPNAENRFAPPTGYQDVWASILFWIYTIGFIALSVWFIIKIKFETSENDNTELNNRLKSQHFIALGVSFIGTIITSYLYIRLVQAYPNQYIKAAFFIAAAAVIVGTIVLVAVSKEYTLVLIGVVFVVVFAIIWFFLRKKIAFSALLLERSALVVRKYPATIFSSVIGAFFSTIVNAILIFGIFGAISYFQKSKNISSSNSQKQNPALYPVYLFYLFYFLWSSQVIMNTIHVTVCGLFATHYFQNGTQGGMPSNPTAAAAKRAITVSFGSICFGSLLVATIKFLRSLLNDSRDNNNGIIALIGCIVDCFLSCIQGLLEFINTYAFIQVAIYGKPFCTAAKDTWKLIKDRGFNVIISDSIIGLALMVGSFIGGALSVAFASIILAFFNEFNSNNAQVTSIVLIGSFIIGILIFYFVTVPLESGTQALMVCIAEDPSIIHRTDREFWEKIRQTFPQAALQGIA